jgi:hypothetical protein
MQFWPDGLDFAAHAHHLETVLGIDNVIHLPVSGRDFILGG